MRKPAKRREGRARAVTAGNKGRLCAYALTHTHQSGQRVAVNVTAPLARASMRERVRCIHNFDKIKLM